MLCGLAAIAVGVFGWTGALQVREDAQRRSPAYGSMLGGAYAIYAALPLIFGGLAGALTHNIPFSLGVAAVALIANVPLHQRAMARWPRLRLTHLTHQELWEVRLSHNRGFVFWATIACVLILAAFAVLVVLAA